MKRNKTLRTITLPTMTAAILATSGLAVAQEPIEIDMPAPTWDRWMYPFNATPCTRPGGSVFGFWSEDLESSTDNRMGQVVFGFDTTGQLAPGQTAGMRVTSAVITMTQQNEGVVYDPTVDPYECMLDTPLIEDEDAGQPVELFGVDYRGGYDQETWPCNGPFSPAGGSWGSRYIFNAGYRDGVLSDVSNQIREEWTPTPFAVSVPEGITAGDIIPLDTVHTFTIDVDDQDIQGYLLDGLERGEIEFGLSTMYRVESQTGTFASFYMNSDWSPRRRCNSLWKRISQAILATSTETAASVAPTSLSFWRCGEATTMRLTLTEIMSSEERTSRLYSAAGTTDPLRKRFSNRSQDGNRLLQGRRFSFFEFTKPEVDSMEK